MREDEITREQKIFSVFLFVANLPTANSIATPVVVLAIIAFAVDVLTTVPVAVPVAVPPDIFLPVTALTVLGPVHHVVQQHRQGR